MKKVFLTLAISILCLSGTFAQRLSITSTSTPYDYSAERRAIEALVKQNEQNQRKCLNELENIENFIISLLSKEIDDQMREFLNAKFKQTQNLTLAVEKFNWSVLGSSWSDANSKVSALKRSISEEIVNYNNRIAAHNAEIERQKQEEERLAKEAYENAVWTGTGFALRDKYLVTNYHVIEEAVTIKILGVNNDFEKYYTAEISAIDKSNDLALLKITDVEFSGFGIVPYYTKTQMSEVGESIFVLGYPLTSTMGDEIKLTTGVISSRTGYQGDVSSYQISAPIQPGNSGAPLFDNKGNLVGIVSSKHIDAENVGYAIKTSYLKLLVESTTQDSILPYNNHTGNLSLSDKVKKLKNYVYIIQCSRK